MEQNPGSKSGTYNLWRFPMFTDNAGHYCCSCKCHQTRLRTLMDQFLLLYEIFRKVITGCFLDGTILLCSQSFWCTGETGPWLRLLGRQERSLCWRLPAYTGKQRTQVRLFSAPYRHTNIVRPSMFQSHYLCSYYISCLNCCLTHPVSFRETLKEVVLMLQNSGSPHAVYIIRILRKWAKENRVLLSWQCWTESSST